MGTPAHPSMRVLQVTPHLRAAGRGHQIGDTHLGQPVGALEGAAEGLIQVGVARPGDSSCALVPSHPASRVAQPGQGPPQRTTAGQCRHHITGPPMQRRPQKRGRGGKRPAGRGPQQSLKPVRKSSTGHPESGRTHTGLLGNVGPIPLTALQRCCGMSDHAKESAGGLPAARGAPAGTLSHRPRRTRCGGRCDCVAFIRLAQ